MPTKFIIVAKTLCIELEKDHKTIIKIIVSGSSFVIISARMIFGGDVLGDPHELRQRKPQGEPLLQLKASSTIKGALHPPLRGSVPLMEPSVPLMGASVPLNTGLF